MSRVMAFLCAVLISQATHAQPNQAALVEAGKAATYLVELPDNKGHATAFCIDADGIFVTCFHVIRGIGESSTIKLIGNSGTDEQYSVETTVIRKDEVNDLAILQAKEPGTFKFLKLPEAPNPFETQTLTTFGFPFGKILALEAGKFPVISVNVGRITSVRKDKNGVQFIQLDAALNPGNSGGPAIDDQGQVMGIVSFGMKASGVNFAMPVQKLLDLLKTPIVVERIPQFTTQSIRSPQTATVTVKALVQAPTKTTVELWLKEESKAGKKYQLQQDRVGRYTAIIQETPNNEKGTSVPVTIEFPQGSMQSQAAQQTIKLGSKEIPLSVIASIECGPTEKGSSAKVYLKDGSEHSFDAASLPKLSVDFGSYPVSIDLTKISRLTVQEFDSATLITHMVIVRFDGKELYRSAQTEVTKSVATNDRSNAVPTPETPARTTASFSGTAKGDQKRVQMPGVITNVVQAGGGYFLLVVLGNEKKLVVFDVTTAKIAKVLALPTSGSLVAGLQSYFIIYDRSLNLFERYNLTTLQKEASAKSPVSGHIKAMASGYAADGPLLVIRVDGIEESSSTFLAVLDSQSFKDITPTMNEEAARGAAYGNVTCLRASANGKAFGMWSARTSPSGLQTVTLGDNTLKVAYAHESVGHIAPTADGTYVVTGVASTYTTTLKNVTPRPSRRPTDWFAVPTSRPRFYLRVPVSLMHSGAPDPKTANLKGTICEIGSEAPLVNLPDLGLGSIEPGFQSTSVDFSLDKRVFYNVAANAVVSIPFQNDAVLVSEFDLKKELKSSNIDYLFVSSTPDSTFQIGKMYNYQITVETNKRAMKYELVSGPERMRVSSSGKLTWSVPANFSEDSVEVIISITDGNQLQSYDSFTISKAKK